MNLRCLRIERRVVVEICYSVAKLYFLYIWVKFFMKYALTAVRKWSEKKLLCSVGISSNPSANQTIKLTLNFLLAGTTWTLLALFWMFIHKKNKVQNNSLHFSHVNTDIAAWKSLVNTMDNNKISAERFVQLYGVNRMHTALTVCFLSICYQTLLTWHHDWWLMLMVVQMIELLHVCSSNPKHDVLVCSLSSILCALDFLQ